MAGLIGICASESARYTKFWSSFYTVGYPEGTMFASVTGPDISYNRNVLCGRALERNADWLWMVDDDHVIPQDTLMKLLARRRDIVVPLILRRRPPFQSVVHMGRDDEGHFKSIELEPTCSGCQKVYAAGTACMLIQAPVLRALDKKTPDFYDRWFEPGLGEDLKFCELANLANFSVWVDFDVQVGHISEAEIWPAFHDGKWMTEVRFGKIAIPLPTPTRKSKDADLQL